MLKKFAAALAASTMVLGTAGAAQAAPSAVALSVAPRAAASVSDENELAGLGTGAIVIGVIALGLVIWGIVELTSDDDGVSP